jgi:hypothetical protein
MLRRCTATPWLVLMAFLDQDIAEQTKHANPEKRDVYDIGSRLAFGITCRVSRPVIPFPGYSYCKPISASMSIHFSPIRS